MKKTGLLLALGLVLLIASVAAPKANAEVVVGVTVGTPVYVRPVVRPYRYFAPRPYVAYVPAPVYRRVYVAPPSVVYYRHWHPHRYYVVHRDFDRRWR